jgi:hypothetical protein
MKKLLLLSAAVFATCSSMNAQSRLSLYEEFTGETCPSCAAANPDLDSLMRTLPNPSHVAMIKYMCDIPSPGPLFYMTNTPFESARQVYYNVPFAPFGTFDGQIPSSSQATSYPGFSAYVTQSDIDQYDAIAAPFNITANYYYNAAHDSITAHITVTCVTAYAPASGVIKLRTALCKSLTFTNPLSNGETDMPHVVRAMYPNVTGTAMAGTWAVGATQTYTVTGAVPSEYNASVPHTSNDSTVVVWIQNDHDQKIAQTAMAQRMQLGVANTIAAPSLTIYPNPAVNTAIISVVTENEGKMSATIIDAAGRVMSTIPEQQMSVGYNNIPINTSTYAAGMYYVRMEMNGNVVTKKFVVAR